MFLSLCRAKATVQYNSSTITTLATYQCCWMAMMDGICCAKRLTLPVKCTSSGWCITVPTVLNTKCACHYPEKVKHKLYFINHMGTKCKLCKFQLRANKRKKPTEKLQTWIMNHLNMTSSVVQRFTVSVSIIFRETISSIFTSLKMCFWHVAVLHIFCSRSR